jgi:uncharacterized membrane protein (DUF106 family)
MARTAEKVESLSSEDPDFIDALAVVVEQAEYGESEVAWSDVRDELTSGQWGRLIQTGVLVDGEEEFVLDDPEGVRSLLEDRGRIEVAAESDAASSGTGGIDDEGSSWTMWDKTAAAASVGLFAGYTLDSVRAAIGGTIDILLGPLNAILPFFAVIMCLALFTGLYSTLLQANLMDMELLGKYQAQMKDIQKRQKAAKERGDDEAVEEIRKEQMEAMGEQLGMFKLQFRPMVWIMLFTIPVFLWMYWMIRDGHVAEADRYLTVPIQGEVTLRSAVVGPIQKWIVWYFFCSMVFTQIIRKALNIQMSPST